MFHQKGILYWVPYVYEFCTPNFVLRILYSLPLASMTFHLIDDRGQGNTSWLIYVPKNIKFFISPHILRIIIPLTQWPNIRSYPKKKNHHALRLVPPVASNSQQCDIIDRYQPPDREGKKINGSTMKFTRYCSATSCCRIF